MRQREFGNKCLLQLCWNPEFIDYDFLTFQCKKESLSWDNCEDSSFVIGCIIWSDKNKIIDDFNFIENTRCRQDAYVDILHVLNVIERL